MRIIAGQFRGIRLTPVGKGDANAHLRPTPDRVREALFNVLSARIDWDGVRVLDLFAGTGALGFEAISRGAAFATIVESGRVGQRLVAANAALLKCAQQVRIIKQDARKLPQADMPCDVVFLDPPYGKGLGGPALERAVEAGWLSAGAWIIVEENAPQEPPPMFELVQHRRYGDTHVSLMRYRGTDE